MTAAFRLILKSGPAAGKTFQLDRPEVFLGRDLNNDFVINDPEVSRRHARLYLQNNYYVLEDLGSTNGTSVGGQHLTGPYLLRPGEMITFGEKVNLLFESTQPAEQGMPTENINQATFAVPPVPGPAYIPAQPPTQPPAYIAPPPPPAAVEQATIYSPPGAPIQPPPVQIPAYTQPPVQAPAYNPPPAQPAYTPPPPPAFEQPPSYQPPAPVAEAYGSSPYAGQVPFQPYARPTVQYRIPVWIFIVIGILLLTILVLLIDDFRLWCPLFKIC